MKEAVVDASVMVKWVLPEPHSDAALRLLTEGVALHAPAHWLAEVGTTIWAKHAVRGMISRRQAEARIGWFGELAITETPIRNLLGDAAAAAFDLRLTIDDTLYLVLARRLDRPLVTADRTLYGKARSAGRFAGIPVWVEDV